MRKEVETNIINMQVVKRDGTKEKVSFDKILYRIEQICIKMGLDRINPTVIAQDTIRGLYDGISTEELDFFAAHRCAENANNDPQYNKLAAGIYISNMHKMTSNDFMKVTQDLYDNINANGERAPLVTTEYYNNVKENINRINQLLKYDRDYLFDFFGIKTLERSYLIKMKIKSNFTGKSEELKNMEKFGRVVERPQHMFMRIALGIHHNNIDKVATTYKYLSKQYFTHASPTMFNAGSYNPQLSSCFLLGMDDNIDSIFETLKSAGKISKWSGGIGINLSDMRASGSYIAGTNGYSDGIVPLMRHINTLAKYINQGGKRNGAIAVYVEPWHADIYNFCDIRKPHGLEEMRAREIFTALWIPDLFMERVRDNKMWSLMCPHECPNLTSTVGDDFVKLYEKYESEGKYKKQVSASELWYHILASQILTGTPYMLYKDHCNRKSNYKHYGVLKNSNLCAEILEYCDSKEFAVCNLASLALPKFVDDVYGQKVFNFGKLEKVTKIAIENLDKIIDINFYPDEKAKYSNFKHRPVGLGVQGLVDVFYLMEIPFDSKQAEILNKQIFETIYYAALTQSMELAKLYGPYETFKGSPYSEGKLQYHLWGLSEKDLLMDYDWSTLIENIKTYGTRNCQLTSIMPTASSSQIIGNTECIEPKTSNIFIRRTIAGEYMIVNNYLVERLIKEGLWNKDVLDEIMFDNGSIQNIDIIPNNIKQVYKTAFDMRTKPILDLAIGRGPFIDQTQSMNIFSKEPNYDTLTKSHFYAWSNGLKTGMYYLRTQPTIDPVKFGVDIEKIAKKRGIKSFDMSRQTTNDDSKECTMCST